MEKSADERATLQLPASASRARSRSHNDVFSETNLWSGSDERPRCSSTSIHDRRRPRSTSPSPHPGAESRSSVILGEDGHATEYLARSMLQLSSIPLLQPPALVPILVEHPPTGGEHYGPPFRVVINASYLNAGSSGNISTKSAPTTPQGEWSAGGGVGSPQTPTPSSSPTPPKSPGRADKADRNVKQLSVSAPTMTQAPLPQKGGDPPSSDGGTPLVPPLTPTPDEPGSSKSRQKKFHRHFKQVAQEERVLNYYSCALVADILLQGQLYITKNYFAFYSNVFGYVTKLLIPTCSVQKISKEKTARIIPNAVGVTTESERHVFGSLLSRDATYKLMMEVWTVAMGPEPLAMLPIKDLADDVDVGTFINLHHEGYESSLSGSERSVALTPSLTDKQQTALCLKKELPNGNATTSVKHESAQHEKPLSSRPPTLLLVSTALLVFLFVSAAFLLYRISMIQTQFSDNPLLSGSDQVYQEIIKWQAQLHSRSANEVQEFLNSNLDQLSKVRKSLEALSQLLLQNEEYARTTRDRQQNYDTSFLRKGNS